MPIKFIITAYDWMQNNDLLNVYTAQLQANSFLLSSFNEILAKLISMKLAFFKKEIQDLNFVSTIG